MNSEQAQAQHDRLQQEAAAHFESTGEDHPSGEYHYGGCWCCCWSEPCDSLDFEEVIANDGDPPGDPPAEAQSPNL